MLLHVLEAAVAELWIVVGAALSDQPHHRRADPGKWRRTCAAPRVVGDEAEHAPEGVFGPLSVRQVRPHWLVDREAEAPGAPEGARRARGKLHGALLLPAACREVPLGSRDVL